MTWNPPPHELMRMYIASLLSLGIEEESIRIMIQRNPAKILELDENS
jgi:predicted metal-dependent phosphotriesterase family hydrolase